MPTKWTLSLAGIALLASTLAATAQDTPKRVDIARYPALGQPAAPVPSGNVANAPNAGGQTDDQPLVENGWDFSHPETIPGFGPWEPTPSTPDVKPAAK